MAAATIAPATLTLALLAELRPATRRVDRVHALVGWTDDGHAIYRPLRAPLTAAGDRGPQLALDLTPDLSPPAVEQLHLDLGDHLGAAASSSCGLTWRTWALASIPPCLRHLPPAGAVAALARHLGG